jgi:hypothetical protein
MAKFVETLQGCFLHKALPKLFLEIKFHEELKKFFFKTERARA